MPGGVLDITIADDWRVTMTGPVTKICTGIIAAESLVSSEQAGIELLRP